MASDASRCDGGVDMRTFIALDLPNEFIEQVADLSRQLSSMVRGRFVARSTYHVTLAFLGEIEALEARRVMDVLDAVCSEAPAVELVPDGLGIYGKPVDATLILRLVHERNLMNLAMGVREELRALGIAYDEKSFEPHVTIARRARVLPQALSDLVFPAKSASDSVTLYKSELSSEGATYKPLYTVRLG